MAPKSKRRSSFVDDSTAANYLWSPESEQNDYKRFEIPWVKTILTNDNDFSVRAQSLIKSCTCSFEKMDNFLRRHDHLLEIYKQGLDWDVQREVCDR
jgi:hypothetical protein